MIRVTKPQQAPRILRQRGMQATQELCAAYDQSPEDYARGVQCFGFDSRLYGARSVKTALRKAQHEKCAFCESKCTHVGYGDVEHFRPKAGAKDQPEDELGRPGYYWLAYDWHNLLFSCPICNQRFKKNLFPLRDPGRRARSHHDVLQDEEPLLIDPARNDIDPADYLGFREEYPYALNGNSMGLATIEVLGLDREELAEVRRERLKVGKLLKQTRAVLADYCARPNPAPELVALLEQIEGHLEASVHDAAEYAAMARALLR